MDHPQTPANSQLRAGQSSVFATIMTHAAVCAILLPVGAQSSIAALLIIYFLYQQSFRKLSIAWQPMEDSPLRVIWRQFFLTLCLVWGLQFLSFIIELIQLQFAFPASREAVMMHLRGIGKWGVYGSLLICVFQLHSLQRFGARSPTIKVQVLIIFTSLYALYMLGQRFYGWNWIHGWDARLGENRFAYGVYRGSGLMGHPLTLAYNAMIFCLLSYSQGLWLWQKHRREAKLWLLQAGLLFYIIILSGSRFPAFLTICLFFTGFFATKMARWRWPLFAAAFGILGLLFGLSLLDPNLQGRLTEVFNTQGDWEERFDRLVFWKVHARMIVDHPFFGVGFAHYKDVLAQYYQSLGYEWVANKYNAHNIYLQSGAQAGLLGLSALALLLGAFFRLARAVHLQWRHLGLLLLACGTILGGLMQNTLQDSEYLYMLWFSLGLTMSFLIDQSGSEARREV